MSDLRQAVEDYLRIRRALGYKLERDGEILPRFVDYLHANGADTITVELALAWATPSDIKPAAWQRRLTVVRGFARYLQTIDPRAEVPPTGILPCTAKRPAPHIYSEAEIAALMAAAARWQSRLGRATLETMVGLLAVTGMRISEAVGLDRDDLDLQGARLVVRNSKFGKSRQLPLDPPPSWRCMATCTSAISCARAQRPRRCCSAPEGGGCHDTTPSGSSRSYTTARA
jgi:integrase/recombinase XerD